MHPDPAAAGAHVAGGGHHLVGHRGRGVDPLARAKVALKPFAHAVLPPWVGCGVHASGTAGGGKVGCRSGERCQQRAGILEVGRAEALRRMPGRPAPAAAAPPRRGPASPKAGPARSRRAAPRPRADVRTRLGERCVEALLGRLGGAALLEQDVAPDAQEVGLETRHSPARRARSIASSSVAKASSKAPRARLRARQQRQVDRGRSPSRRGPDAPAGRPAISRTACSGSTTAAQRPGAHDLSLDADSWRNPARPRAAKVVVRLRAQALAVAAQLEQAAGPWPSACSHDQRVVQPARERQPLLVAGARPVRLAEAPQLASAHLVAAAHARVVGAVGECVRAVPLRVVERPAALAAGLRRADARPVTPSVIHSTWRACSRRSGSFSRSAAAIRRCAQRLRLSMLGAAEMDVPEVPFGDELRPWCRRSAGTGRGPWHRPARAPPRRGR